MNIGYIEVYGVIYKITNKVNGKIYIGQTTDGFKIRYNGGKWWIQTHNNHLKSSVEKYGVENFEISEIFDVAFSKKELDIKEILYINYYNSNNRKFGYNKKDGGANGKHSDEAKRKMSKAHLGSTLSEETKKNMSKVRKGKQVGEDNPMYGKNPLEKLSEEEYNSLMEIKSKNMTGKNNPMYGKCGELNSFYGREHTEETKKILSEKTRERLAKYNPLKGRKNDKLSGDNAPSAKNNIEVYNENLELIYVFTTVKQCCEWIISTGLLNNYNSARDAINTAIRKDKFYKGYFFKKVLKDKYKQ